MCIEMTPVIPMPENTLKPNEKYVTPPGSNVMYKVDMTKSWSWKLANIHPCADMAFKPNFSRRPSYVRVIKDGITVWEHGTSAKDPFCIKPMTDVVNAFVYAMNVSAKMNLTPEELEKPDMERLDAMMHNWTFAFFHKHHGPNPVREMYAIFEVRHDPTFGGMSFAIYQNLTQGRNNVFQPEESRSNTELMNRLLISKEAMLL